MCLKDAVEAAVRRPHLWEATALAIGLSKRYGLAPVEPIEGAEFIVFASSLADLLRAGHWQQAMDMCRTKPW